MITDIHRHFVPSDFFDFVKARPEFSVKVKREEGESIDVDIRGMHFGLNKTFFELGRQIERMKGEGVERAILSLATPFINYHLDSTVAVKAARRFNDSPCIGDCGKFRPIWRLGLFADAKSGRGRGRAATLCPRIWFRWRTCRLKCAGRLFG